MKYSGSSFTHEFCRSLRAAKARLLGRAAWALFFAVCALAVTGLLPRFMPAAADRLPDFWADSLFGAVYLYTLAAVPGILFGRLFATQLFEYGGIAGGRWNLAVQCGVSPRTLCAAKFTSALWAPLTTYLMGFALTLGGSIALGKPASGLGDALRVAAVGALSLLAVVAVQALFGALGLKGAALSLVALPFVIALCAGWYFFGFLSVTDFGSVAAAVARMLAFPVGLPLVCALLLAAAAAVSLTAPVSRIGGYTLEDLDDDMLRALEFRADLEVYEKDGEEYELMFSGKDITEG